MSLRLRLAAAFALVALVTAAAVALATPIIVGRGFARLEAAGETQAGSGPGRGPGPMNGIHAEQIQQETTLTIVAVALAAAGAASLLGVALAGRVARPLGQLEGAASAVARGDLTRRSGLADRGDEIGSLGRSFDAMADELARSETARRRFFQDVVHELKTPLAVIDATTTAVLDGVYAHDDRHLATIRDQSRLLARIVDDLRTISLAKTGVLPLAIEPVAVDPLLADTAGSAAARAAAAGVRIEVAARPGLVVRADRDRLGQVLAALLDNALRHSRPGGAIILEAGEGGQSSQEGRRVRLAVRDEGPGIAAEDLPHLFERFYQADPARDRAAGASGLGLAIARAVVDAHGGSIGAENAVGGGARFWVDLDPAAS